MAGGPDGKPQAPAGYLQKTLKALQAQRDAGILSPEEYRRAAAAVVNTPDPESGHSFTDPGPGRTPIPGMQGMHSLTGAVGAEVSGRGTEYWLHSAVSYVSGKHIVGVIVFVLLTAYLVVQYLVEAKGGVDPGAGVGKVGTKGPAP